MSERKSRYVQALRETAALNAAAAKLGFQYGGPFPVSGHHLMCSQPPKPPMQRASRPAQAPRTVEIERRLKGGECSADIAKDMNVTKQWVHHIAKRLGISGRRIARATLEKRARIARERDERKEGQVHYRRTVAEKALEMRAAGMVWTEIMAVLGPSSSKYFLEFYPEKRERAHHNRRRRVK